MGGPGSGRKPGSGKGYSNLVKYFGKKKADKINKKQNKWMNTGKWVNASGINPNRK